MAELTIGCHGGMLGLPRLLELGLAGAVIGLCCGCVSPFEPIDPSLAREARMALRQERPPPDDEPEEENAESYTDPRTTQKSVIVAELLAIFPGLFWHGLGHQYAGDDRTAKEIREMGQWGYLLGAIGGGMLVGGYFLDKEGDSPWDSYALTLYITGGITGSAGAIMFLSAWIYDIVDTPRAVRSGGKPDANSIFHQDLKAFDNDR